MQTLTIISAPDYQLLVFTGICVLAVGFMLWFLIALILDVRKAQQKRLVFHQQQRARFAYPAHRLSAEVFEMEGEHARTSLDSCDDRIFRGRDRIRPLLRSRKVIRDPKVH